MTDNSNTRIRALTVSFLIAVLLVSFNWRRAHGETDETPRGLGGASAGLAMHTGRDNVIDAISGASTRKDENIYYDFTIVGSVFLDFGFSTSKRGWPGVFGLRTFFDLSLPGPFYQVVFLPRYRFNFVIQNRRYLRFVELWGGVGLAFQFTEIDYGDAFVSFPAAAGLDFGFDKCFYITTQIDVSMFNPFGPVRAQTVDGSKKVYESHYDNVMVKLGLAFRFY